MATSCDPQLHHNHTTKPTNLVFPWETPGSLMAVDTEAALPGYLDEPGVGAAGRGLRQVFVTQRSTAHSTIDAGALVFTAGMENLTILVHPAVVLACASLGFC